ncbi:MAG TPA: ATP-binding protein [Polaromonas sp.]|uniref:sensor histidine kinase n=1 Tax=Polaromonas sp. TaxID=1869339 RepID=UPI002D3CA2AB|nr:ATP-binding protein [Polaromonas sp.]HYW57834.1 ATP-binding protein [Polaromonas sp.]
MHKLRAQAEAQAKYQRHYEFGLVAGIILGVLLAAAICYYEIARDKQVTISTSVRLTESLAQSLEGQINSTLRDAENAATSAIILIENSGGLQGFRSEKHLHDELKRELWNESSTRRLMALDLGGRVVASSAEYPLPPKSVVRELGRVVASAQPGGRNFRLELPQQSVMDGQLVIPYSSDVYDSKGTIIGTIRAELRVDEFLKRYGSIAALSQGAIVLMTVDGYTMLRAPLAGWPLGERPADVQSFLDQATGQFGNLEYTPERDGIRRYYSWRKMKDYPFILAVGLEKDGVLEPWRRRSGNLAIMVGSAAATLALFACLLMAYLRQLTRRHSDILMKYWAATENSSIGIVISSLEGQKLHANSAICAMLGYSKEEFMLLPFGSTLVPESARRLALALDDLRSGKTHSLDTELCGVTKAGTPLWTAAHFTVMQDASGKPTELLVYSQDITARKRAEEEIHELNKSLERRVEERTVELSRANKDLEAFSYSAAHDLRSPLAVVAGYADLLTRDLADPPEKVALYLSVISRQARQMASTVGSLLTLSQLGNAKLNRVSVDLYALVIAIRDDLMAQASGRRVEWRIGVLPNVRADAGMLRVALTNILGNALKYSRDRDPAIIEVGTVDSSGATPEASAHREVTFFIRDNGAGFDMKHADDLFAPFKRLHTATEFEGTGIGLASVQRIIDRNDGRITGSGEPDRGATFVVTLPGAWLD